MHPPYFKIFHTWGRNWHKLSTWIFNAATCSSTVFRVVSFLLICHVDVLVITWISRVIMIFSGTLNLISKKKKKKCLDFWEYTKLTKCKSTLKISVITWIFSNSTVTEGFVSDIQHFNDELIPLYLWCYSKNITNISKYQLRGSYLYKLFLINVLKFKIYIFKNYYIWNGL